MTVKELIEKLKEVDPNLEVFAPGYEGGYRDIETDFVIKTYRKDVNTEWWYGPHEEDKNGTIRAIVL